MPETEKVPLPSEMRLQKQWDFAIEQFIMKTTISVAVAGVASLVLFRAPSARRGFILFGAGFGAGDAYRSSNAQFEREKASNILFSFFFGMPLHAPLLGGKDSGVAKARVFAEKSLN